MKKTLLLVLLTLASAKTFSQDFPFGKITLEELDLKKYDKDTTAHAVVLKEYGNAYISDAEGIPLIFEYHVKIKLFNNKSFEKGNVVIPVYKGDNDSFEKISDVKASAFFINQNGGLQEAKLEENKIYKENKNKYWDLIKFAIPNLTEGCVIEYSYKLTSPYIFKFHSWEFQDDIPKISSEYTVHIPAVYTYNVSLVGFLPLKSAPKTSIEKDRFFPMGGVKSDCSKLTYEMENIPALVEEDYMTSAKNFRSAINFQLSEYVNYLGHKITVTKEWKDIDNELKHNEFFGSQLRKKDFFKDKLSQVTAGTADDLEKAKAVYKYVQNWYKWNNLVGVFSDKGIRKAYESHSGDVADINLSLIAALNSAGINTEAVLLSTRDNGIINKLYPVVTDFNYVIAKANIGDKTFLLDATDPFLTFGLLPLKCINDQGRVISSDKASYWIDLTLPQKESKVYTMNFKLEEDGKIKGKMTIYSIGYEAYNKRKTIKKFNSVEEYVENLDENSPKMKILNSEIKNLEDFEMPVSEEFEVEIAAFDTMNREKYLLNPFLVDRQKENPFKLNERTYPIDMGALSETRVVMNLTLPEKFAVSEKPEPVALALPGNGGSFQTDSNIEGNTVTFSQVTKFNKSIFSSQEYPFLKELFNKMVQTQNSEFIFQKQL